MTTYAYDLTLNDSEFGMLHMSLELTIDTAGKRLKTGKTCHIGRIRSLRKMF